MLIVINNNKDTIGKKTRQLTKFLDKTKINYKVFSHVSNVEDLDKSKIKGIILSGSYLNLSQPVDIQLVSHNIAVLLRCPNIPILGICFGFQIMCLSYGGRIEHMGQHKNGLEQTNIVKLSPLFKGLPSCFDVCSYHGDKITYIPQTFEIICEANDGTIQGIQNLKTKRFGLQFHPESNNKTIKILKNFLDICEIENPDN
jgi:GMP synthase (glutamine-hydrolysing)